MQLAEVLVALALASVVSTVMISHAISQSRSVSHSRGLLDEELRGYETKREIILQ